MQKKEKKINCRLNQSWNKHFVSLFQLFLKIKAKGGQFWNITSNLSKKEVFCAEIGNQKSFHILQKQSQTLCYVLLTKMLC